MFALPTMQTAVLDIAHFLWVPAPEHLVHEFIIVALIVPRIDVLEPVPVLDKDLFEDVPVPRRFCNHQDAPSWSIGIVAVQLFTTPHQRSPPPPRPSQRNAHPPLSPWSHEDFRAAEKWKFLLCCRCCQAPLHIFFFPLFFSLRAVSLGQYVACPQVFQCSW